MKKADLVLLVIAVICILIILILIATLQSPALLQWLINLGVLDNTAASGKNIIFTILLLAITTTITIFILFIKLIFRFTK